MLFWLGVGAIVAYLFYTMYSQIKKLPPGPVPLPFIGNLHQFAFAMLKGKGVISVLNGWKEKYGHIYTFWIGPLATVNICDYQTSQDAMIKKGGNFADRVDIYLFNIVRKGRGIIISNGDHWQEQRRFTLHTLRNFGLGRNVMQDRIMLEFDYRENILSKDIDKAGGQLDIDPYHFLELTVGNIINRLLFTERFIEKEEAEFFKLKKKLDELMENSSILDFILNEKNSEWPFLKQHKDKICQPIFDVLDFVKEQVKKRKAEIASGEHEIRDNGEDFVDAFLLEMEKPDRGASFDEESLVITVLDLWFAGQETTAVTLYWALAYLILHPEVYKKLQDELDDLTGQNRPISLMDKQKTPYLNAVILEVLRVSKLVPMNLWRVTKEDTVVGEFLIPKGTAITSQISLIMSDKSTFADPEKFDPTRFIENNNQEQHVVAFGLGKRACLGESLARAELYLILGNFALKYNIAPNKDHPASVIPLNEKGAVRRAKPYRLLISKRD